MEKVQVFTFSSKWPHPLQEVVQCEGLEETNEERVTKEDERLIHKYLHV